MLSTKVDIINFVAYAYIATEAESIAAKAEHIKTNICEDIEFAHKACIKDLKKGDPVYKYGEEIGYMLADAPKGTWIHNHNMDCDRGKK